MNSRLSYFRTGSVVKCILLVCMFGIFSFINPAFARQKSVTSEFKPNEWKDEKYYDKLWRRFLTGTPKEKNSIVKELQSLLRKNPLEYRANYYLGIIFYERDSYASSEKHFRLALNGFRKSADVHYRLGLALVARKKKYEDGIEHFRIALKYDPDHSGALGRLGIFYLENGDYDTSLEMLAGAREGEPDNREVLCALGFLYVEQGLFSSALEVLKIAVALDSRDAETHWLTGKAYEGLGLHNEASAAFEEAKRLGRSVPNIRELIGYDLARSLYDQGRIEEAVGEYKKVAASGNDPAHGWFEIGRIREEYGDAKPAIKAYERAFSYDGNRTDAIFRIADLYRNEENYDMAVETLRMISRRRSDDALRAREDIEILREEQMAFEREKLMDQAGYASGEDLEMIYLVLLEMDGKDRFALEGLRTYYEEEGYFDEAVKIIRKLRKAGYITKWEAERDIKELKSKWQ